MIRFLPISLALAAQMFAAAPLPAQEKEKKPESGLQPGQFLPGSFQCFNLTGDRAGRFHCIVCRQALYPTVLIFVREPADLNEPFSKPFVELLKRLDVLGKKYADVHFTVAVVYLTSGPDVQRDLLAKKIKDELVMKEDVKQVVFAWYPLEKDETGPKDYNLPKENDLVVLVYSRLRVRASYLFSADKPLAEKDIEPIVAEAQSLLPATRR